MTDLNLNQAREWAERMGKIEGLTPGPRAAAEVIQALPDQWVDAGRLRQIIDFQGSSISDEARKDLETLFTPKLPTLADMDEDARHALIGKDVNVERWNNPSMLIAVHKNEGAVLGHDWINPWPFVEVRPLSELTPVNATPGQQANSSESPKSSLPRPEGCCGKCPETASGGWDCRCEDNPRCSKNTPNPEEVPADEIWLVEYFGDQWLGHRNRNCSDHYPWRIASTTGEGSDIASDSQITLIHKLVPETHALPEGMRLADSKEYGRVVVSPRLDEDGAYKVFYLDKDYEEGATYEYAHPYGLTFLDGEA